MIEWSIRIIITLEVARNFNQAYWREERCSMNAYLAPWFTYVHTSERMHSYVFLNTVQTMYSFSTVFSFCMTIHDEYHKYQKLNLIFVVLYESLEKKKSIFFCLRYLLPCLNSVSTRYVTSYVNFCAISAVNQRDKARLKERGNFENAAFQTWKVWIRHIQELWKICMHAYFTINRSSFVATQRHKFTNLIRKTLLFATSLKWNSMHFAWGINNEYTAHTWNRSSRFSF